MQGRKPSHTSRLGGRADSLPSPHLSAREQVVLPRLILTSSLRDRAYQPSSGGEHASSVRNFPIHSIDDVVSDWFIALIPPCSVLNLR